MSKKSFLTIADGSTVTFDADQAKNFKVTLEGNRSLVIAGGQEGDEIGILLVQDSTGSRVPTWGSNVSWKAGASPNLTTAASGTDLITFVRRGSTWEDKGGAPSKLPSRLSVAALATITVVNVVAATLNLSSGTGAPSNITTVEDAFVQYVGTGSNKTMVRRDEGSGSILLTSSGGNATGLGIGVPRLKSTSKITDANAYINAEGELTGSSAMLHGTVSGSLLRANTLSGGTLNIRKIGAGSGKIVVHGSDGGGECFRDSDGGGWTTCEYLDGVQRCVIASAATCP